MVQGWTQATNAHQVIRRQLPLAGWLKEMLLREVGFGSGPERRGEVAGAAFDRRGNGAPRDPEGGAQGVRREAQGPSLLAEPDPAGGEFRCHGREDTVFGSPCLVAIELSHGCPWLSRRCHRYPSESPRVVRQGVRLRRVTRKDSGHRPSNRPATNWAAPRSTTRPPRKSRRSLPSFEPGEESGDAAGRPRGASCANPLWPAR